MNFNDPKLFQALRDWELEKTDTVPIWMNKEIGEFIKGEIEIEKNTSHRQDECDAFTRGRCY